MASTHYRRSSQLDVEQLQAAPPHIYISPPVEDEIEPWLCFDASNPFHDPYNEFDEDSYSGLDHVHSLLHFQTYYYVEPQDPAQPSHHPADPRQARIEAPTIESDVHGDVLLEHGVIPPSRNTCIQSREPGNDSEVIEVVRLPRSSDASQKDLPEPPKRSESILSRAFRSIKNVGKTSKSQTSSKPSSQSVEGPAQRSKLTRKRTASRPDSVISNPSLDFPTSELGASPSDIEANDVGMRPASPSPSTFSMRTAKSSFSSARRFSMMSLNKLFNIGSQSHPDLSSREEVHSEEREHSPDSTGPSIDSSTTCSSIPGTPVSAPLPLFPSDVGKEDHVLSGEGDESLEMRLDSLHFDSLSFDANDFQ